MKSSGSNSPHSPKPDELNSNTYGKSSLNFNPTPPPSPSPSPFLGCIWGIGLSAAAVFLLYLLFLTISFIGGSGQ